MDNQINQLNPGEQITLTETNSARVIAERTGNGKRVRIVRETPNGFQVVTDNLFEAIGRKTRRRRDTLNAY